MMAVLAVVACGSTPERLPTPEPDPLRARAALATVHVDNGTAERITVLYRITGPAAPFVAIGTAAPGARARLAPVPAREPITLIARTDAGAELVLPARTFEIDGEWTWQIPPDARFEGSPPDEARP